MKVYKLTDQNMQTRGGFQWTIDIERDAPGVGPLCSSGWLHCYSDPLLAVFLNPAHASINNPRLFEAEASGVSKDDAGLKLGVQKLTLRREMPLPSVTLEQRVRFAVLCALSVCEVPHFVNWAEKWLSGEDRSAESARAASASAWAVAESAAVAASAAAAAKWAAEETWAAVAAAAVASAKWAAARTVGKPLDLIAMAKKAVAP
jgi:hypothetical protein